jgi:hypothetical protein
MGAVNIKILAAIAIILALGIFSGLLISQYLNRETYTNLSESLELINQHFWGGNNWTEATIVVVNTGEKDVAIKKLTVLGIECDWSRIYFWKTDSGPVTSELVSTFGKLSGTSFRIVVEGIERDFQQATDELTLKSRWTIVLYVKNPSDVPPTNVPSSATIAVFTETRMYYRNAKSEVTFTFTKTEELKITGHTWLSNTQIRLTVKNTGASDLTISGAQVDDNAASFTVVASANLAKGDSANVTITKPTTTFTSGVKYNVAVLTAGGNKYMYQATYP